MERTQHPVDKGWAWVIVTGVFVTQFISIGFLRSYGLLFVAFQEQFGYSAGILSVVIGVHFICQFSTSLLVTNVLLKLWTARVCCAIGVSLQCLSVILSMLIPGPGGLIFSHGVLYGTGMGFIFLTGLLIVSEYFLHRRYIATVVASCGSPVGGMVFPLIDRYLLTAYGLKGALLILSGLILHQLLFVILFTPPSEYKPIQSEHLAELTGQLDLSEAHTDLRRHSSDANGSAAVDNTTLCDVTDSNRRMINPDLWQVTTDSRKTANENDISSSPCKVKCFDSFVPSRDDDVVCQEEANVESQRQILDGSTKDTATYVFGQKFRHRMSVPVVFRLKSFWLLIPVFMAFTMTFVCPIFLPPLFKERGLTLTVGAFFMTLAATMDLLGRLVPGLILQVGLLTPTQLSLIAFSGCCVTYALTPLYHDDVSLAVLASVYGCLGGGSFAFQTLVVIEQLGMQHLASAMGFYSIVIGMSAGISYPITGFLKNWTGSYSASFMFQASIYLLGIAFLVLVMLQRKTTTPTTKL